MNLIDKAVYQAFGFAIRSDIPLPELRPVSAHPLQETAADITIYLHEPSGEHSGNWPIETGQTDETGQFIVISADRIQFQVPEVALFTIESGERVTIWPGTRYDEDLVRLYVLGTCFGVLLMQRGILPLHGSAVVIDGRAWAFVGDSGAGKSTLASTLIQHGYTLISDDILAITFAGDIAFITPSYPQQKLWQESLDHFGLDASGYRSIYGRETKYGVPIDHQFASEPIPLLGICELVKEGNTDTEGGIQPLVSGVDRLSLLASHTYRNFLLPMMNRMEWHFHTSVRLARIAEFYQIIRPRMGFSAHRIALDVLRQAEHRDLAPRQVREAD